MGSNTRNNLVFLERQFNTVKTLIPTANEYISKSSAPEKIVIKYFNVQSRNWDMIKFKKKLNVYEINLSEKEEWFLSERIVLLMNLLVKLKRISKEAKNSQKSYKITLYELLVRLKDQVMSQSPVGISPSFMQIDGKSNQSKSSFNVNLSFGQIFGKKEREYQNFMDELNSFEIPEFVSKVLKEQYAHLYHLANIGKEKEKSLEKEYDKFTKLKQDSLKKKKEYEAKGYEIIGKMIKVEIDLNTTIRNNSKPILQSFIPKMKENIEMYNEEK